MNLTTPRRRLPPAVLLLVLAASALAPVGCQKSPREGGARSQKNATPDQSALVEQIFQKYTEAVGGEEAVARVESYALKGVFQKTGSDLTLPVEIFVKKPDMALMVIEVPRVGRIRRGMSAEGGWVQTPFAVVSTGDSPGEIVEVERDHDIYQAGRIRRLYREVKLEGSARLKGRDVYVIEGKADKGPSEKMLFDKETGLLLRWDIVRRPPGKPTVFARVYLDDYRDVGGVKVPFTIRYFFEPREFTLRLNDVRHNVPLDDSMFAKPAARTGGRD